MNIDYSALRSVMARDLAAALRADGLIVTREKGSHRSYALADGRRVTFTFHHASDTFPLPTLKSIVERQALWSELDLTRLGLR